MTGGAPGPPEEGAILLADHGAAYVEIPKVACSSIKIVLAGVLGLDLRGAGGDPHQVDFPMRAPSREGPAPYPGLFSFAFVRNPWDRLVSCYRDKVRGEAPDFTGFHPERGVAWCLARFDVFRPEMSFAEFVGAVAEIPDADADEHFRSQHTFVTDGEGRVGVDFVGRFETLSRDFRRVCEGVGLPEMTLPRVQAARTVLRYADFFTPETRDVVARRFREDVALFDCRFEGR